MINSCFFKIVSLINSLMEKHRWVNIQFKGYLVSFGYSERTYKLCFLFNMQCAKIHEFVHKCNVSQYLTPET